MTRINTTTPAISSLFRFCVYWRRRKKANYGSIWYLSFACCLLLYQSELQAQDVDLFEDFDACVLPTGWTANVNGSTAVWGVDTVSNANSAVGSMDGSCMLYFDDDAAGNGTAAWSADIISPAVDATVNSTLFLEMDVHFRNVDGSSSLTISVYDGTQYVPISVFQGQSTGDDFDQFITINADLTAYINDNLSIQISFDDGNIWAWWASVDNFHLHGSGNANNILVENFNACTLPTDWETQVLTGYEDWSFDLPNGDASNSIDGTCFARFDDDAISDTAATSIVRLASPFFDGSSNLNINLDFDLYFREWNQSFFRVLVFDGQTHHTVVTYQGDNVGGDNYAEFEHQTIDLSAYRNSNMRLVFEYNDGNTWAWLVGLDNVRVSGTGIANDDCDRYVALNIGETCDTTFTNNNALTTGPAPSCVDSSRHALWYGFVAPNSGSVTISTAANFNEIITVFEANNLICDNLTELACANADEFGFTGETLRLTGLTANTPYFIRVSGVQCDFGAGVGTLCIEVEDNATLPTPPINDLCTDAAPLILGATCVQGTNLHATFAGPTPSLNNRSRSSIWYSFVAPQTGTVILESGADFADVLTVFDGTCGNLTEIATTDYGQELLVEGLTNNQTYYVQVTGYFATVEGNVCMALKAAEPAPVNDLCVDAANLTLGAACMVGNNEFATMGTVQPSCDIFPTAAIWFSFDAPSTGTIRVHTHADFVHVLSLYQGDCNSLSEVACDLNPDKCGDGTLIENLVANDTYYLQVASAQTPFGYTTGEVCMRVEEVVGEPVKVKIRAFLQGTYMGNGEMATALQSAYLIPSEQPFNVAPWNYNGTECAASFPETTVDWVLVELRDANDNETVIEQKAALLHKEGNITERGKDGVYFDNAIANENYYLVVRHRSHLAVISEVAVPVPNAVPYNMAGGDAYTLGVGQTIDLGDGNFALRAGDANSDGVITITDFNHYTQEASALYEYLDADCNLDGAVTIADYNLYQVNASVIGVDPIRY